MNASDVRFCVLFDRAGRELARVSASCDGTALLIDPPADDIAPEVWGLRLLSADGQHITPWSDADLVLAYAGDGLRVIRQMDPPHVPSQYMH